MALRSRVLIAVVISAALMQPVRADAQNPSSTAAPAQTFNRLSIEELTRINVTSASRRLEPVSDASAAIQVLTQDDLHRAGVLYLAEALRLADGMYVGRFDGRTWIVQPRGLAINGANKMQVLLDGRSLYSPLYSGIFWDVQDYPIDEIDRIEIIRGPGASLWGANAVNGVINVITKRASESAGATASVGLGTEDRALAVARYGARLGAGANYRAYAKFTYRDAQVLSTGASAEDPLRRGQTGFRIDWDRSSRNQFTVQGDLYVGRLGLRNSADTPVSGGDLLARWTHVGVRGQRWETKVYYDRVARTVPGQVGEKRNTVDFEIQQEMTRGTRHHIVWGGGYRASSDHTATTVVFFDPSSRTTQLGNVFAQDEIAFGSAAALTVGTKLERNTYTGIELQPTLRGRSRVGRIGTAWGAVSRAVRMPTRFDTDIRVLDATGVLLASGNPDFESEELVAYEGGFRTLALNRVSFDVSVYRNVYDNLRSQELGASSGALITLDNGIAGRVVGAELGTNVQLSQAVQLHGSYTRIARTLTRKPGSRDITGGEGNDPRHMATLQAFTTPSASLSVSMLLRYVGELPNPLTPAYTDADAVVNWQVTPRAELQFVGQNIFHESRAEFPQAAPVFELVQRNLLVRLNLRLR